VPLCVQKLFPGLLTAARNREMENFAAGNIVARLWEQDASLWPAEQHEVASIKSNLRWLNLPEQIAAYISQVMDAAVAAKNEGLDKLVFVGMGGSNLACATVLDLLEPSARKHIHLRSSSGSWPRRLLVCRWKSIVFRMTMLEAIWHWWPNNLTRLPKKMFRSNGSARKGRRHRFICKWSNPAPDFQPNLAKRVGDILGIAK
jgi:hypothetical protein